MKATIRQTLLAAAICTAFLAAPAQAGQFENNATYERTTVRTDDRNAQYTTGPVAYTETTTTSEIYTSRGHRGFTAAEYDAQHSTCKTCVDGIYGHGGKPNNWD